MNNFLKKIIYKLLKKTEPQPVSSFCSKNSRKFFTGNDSLSIEVKQILLKENINNEAKTILKEAVNNPEILVEFIKSKGTGVIKSVYMNKILFLLGEQQGFIPPMNGYKAFLFAFLINLFSTAKLQLSTSTPALFAFDDKPVNIYFLSHQFHLWLSYINELPGFSQKTRKNFKSVWNTDNDSMEINKLSTEEMLSLKDAIARDIEAVNFVKEIAQEFIGQKQSLEKIRLGKRVNI